MNKMLTVFAMLLGATVFFLSAMNFMADNIEDFESLPLPPKKVETLQSKNPTIKVDATSRDRWTLVDFSKRKTYHVDDPEKAKNKLEQFNWDLGFHRTKIIANGGITNNNGKVGVVNMGQIDFDDVKEAPSGGYIQDSRSFGSVVNKGIADWYNYRTRTHNVESRKNVYVVKSSEDEYIKIRILNYYCSRDEKDCRTIMCTRAEAACLTIEYVLSDKGTRIFPISTDPQLAQNNQPGYP